MVKVVTLLWKPNERSFSFSRCYSEEWVEKLYDGFERNLSLPFEFVCFVDDVKSFRRPITQVLIDGNPNYGSCIQPYKLNQPMILVGLDTVITGNVDHIATYCLTGEKILLPRDPNNHDIACNGVALVSAGNVRVYSEWNGQNDMEWMRNFHHEFIDDHFPFQVNSYKGRVKKHGLGDSRIVYFHGREKPHELDLPWIKEHWKLNE